MGGIDEMEGILVRRAKANNMYHVCLDLAFDPCCMITSVSHLFCYSLVSPVE